MKRRMLAERHVPRRRWLELKGQTKRAEAALCAALDVGDDAAACRVLCRRHWVASLRWPALADAAGAIDLFGTRPWPGLVAGAATAEALRRRAGWRYLKRERPGRERFNWGLEQAGVIYASWAGACSDTQLAQRIGVLVDQEERGDHVAIGLELLRERVRQRGRLSEATRKALAPCLAAQHPMTRELAFAVVAAVRPRRPRGRKPWRGRRVRATRARSIARAPSGRASPVALP